LRGIVLSGACVGLTSLVPVDFVALASTITGLILAKFCENMPLEKNSTLDDVLPPFCWLTAVMWITSVDAVKDQPMQAGLILGIMAVSLMMRFLQGPFVFVGKLEDDKIFVKRVMLSLTAGLAVLCVVVKMLNLLHFQSLALICAAGYFISYLYKDLDGDSRYALAPMQGLRLLILIGLMTLVATRLYGTFGLLTLAPTAMVAPVSSAVLIPGIFFCSRALLQVYLQHFNENVTGINLTHAYASAAQYAGFLLGIALLLLLKEKINRKVLLSITLSVCIVVPILSNFLLNSEPSCSLFASVIVSSLLLAVLAPALQGDSTVDGAENICLVPGLMISSGILTSGLLELGNTATKMIKGTVLSYGIIFVIVMSFIFWFFFQRKADKNNTAASADGI
jgi:hypothetical protein